MNHRILTRGPEGEQVHKDKGGKVVKGDGSVSFIALERYEAELRRRAGLPVSVKTQKRPATSGVKALNQLAQLLGQEGIKA
jgi:hypothetical protein